MWPVTQNLRLVAKCKVHGSEAVLNSRNRNRLKHAISITKLKARDPAICVYIKSLKIHKKGDNENE